MSRNGREALRAVYLASPLKFCSTLHAFAPVVPQYHINPWEKDPWAWQKHKYHRSRQRSRGRLCYIGGPLSGMKTPGWPEPSLLGVRGLIEAASRAQGEGLEDGYFWHQVAERAIKLRDVMQVSDLAVLLDALLSANYRHTHLMKTLSRELIDDVDKLTLTEAAVVMNAYAHFSCISAPLLASVSEHIVRLLTKQPYTSAESSEKYGVEAAEPQTLAVLCKALASLQHKDIALLKAVNACLVERIEDASFGAVSDILNVFSEMGEAFEAPPAFWTTLAAKVPGSPMRHLCPTLRSLSKLDVSDPALCQAIGNEIVSGLRSAPVGSALLEAPGKAPLLAQRRQLPAFAAATPMPAAMLATTPPAADAAMETTVESDLVGEDVVEFREALVFQEEAALEDEQADQEGLGARRKRRRWYNAVTRKLDSLADDDMPKVPFYASFNAEEHYRRNLRGARVAQALEGFGALEQLGSTASSSSASSSSGGNSQTDAAQSDTDQAASARPLHQELLSAAGPVLSSAAQGLSTSQLAACVELFAQSDAAKGDVAPTVHLLMRESVRRLSNFSAADLRRLHAASHAAGMPDPYLERARRRRFPKALRKELRSASAEAEA
eukprot:TRINITY_DN29189_c0_g1_i1.p1 TRINITY_DN29189_c0_g1~~TRINITY_DN29189_c0_g1_i1.p1  ORF type:complete len:609 (-),score=147.41 TRINITY_DN29189_c0_g1_i1:101-1927(-)